MFVTVRVDPALQPAARHTEENSRWSCWFQSVFLALASHGTDKTHRFYLTESAYTVVDLCWN